MAIVRVRGLKELQARLRQLSTVSGTKAMRSSMFTATKPILDKAKATAPVASGALRQAIARTFSVKSGSRVVSEGSGSRFSILIGPKVRNRTAIALYNLVHQSKRSRRGIIHGHFLEFGTRTGTRATHWLIRSLQSTASQAVELLAATLKKRIEAAVRK